MELKIKTILFFFFTTIVSISQQKEIFVNNNKFVTLVFPSNITKATVGSDHYLFDFAEDGSQNIGLLKCVKNAPESNLLVMADNTLYSFSIAYKDKIHENIITIAPEQGIVLKNQNNEAGQESKESIKQENKVIDNIKENDYYIGNKTINDAQLPSDSCKRCEGIAKKGKKVKKIQTNAYNIKLELDNVYYSKNKLFITATITNNSKIDYYINYIKTYITTVKNNSSTQYLEKNPIDLYNNSRIIKNKDHRTMIFIYEQFTIDNNKELVFELNEHNGERNLVLNIPHYIINNPIKFK